MTNAEIIRFVRSKHPSPGVVAQGMRFMHNGRKFIITSVNDVSVKYVTNDHETVEEAVFYVTSKFAFQKLIDVNLILPAHVNI